MEDKEVAVVGGGLTGLSAAYDLSREGFDVKVFEKEAMLGGRAPRANQLVPSRYQHFLKLMEELGIEDEVLEEINFSDMAALTDNGIKSFEPFSLFLRPEEDLSFVERYVKRPFFSKIMGIDVSGVRELREDLEAIDFCYSCSDDEAERLHGLTAEEWIEEYPESVQEKVLYPALQTLYVEDLDNLNAEVAAQHVKDFMKSASGKFREVSGGPLQVTRSIREKTEAEFEVNTEVKNVNETEEGVELETGEGEESFDQVILAVPLNRSGEILDEEFGISYSFTRAVTVDGEPREEFVNLIGADRDDNIRAVLSPGNEFFAYPEDSAEEMDLEKIFDEHEVLGEEKTLTHPLLEPGKDIPDQEYSERIILAGDFYRFSGLETAVYTGRRAASKAASRSQ